MSRARLALAVLLAAPCVAVAGLLLALPWLNLAPLVASRASAALGRAVTIEQLHLSLGRGLGIELRGVRLANLPGGSTPEMLTLETARAAVPLLPLLRGEVVLREAEASGLSLLLERDDAQRRNWRFAGPDATPTSGAASRGALPWPAELRLRRGLVVVRGSSGAATRVELASVSLLSPTATTQIQLAAEGAYNGAAVTVEGTLGTPAQLRMGQTPFPMALQLTRDDAVLRFDGTADDPLGLDGLAGRVRLQAPRLGTLGALVGEAEALPVPLELAADGVHQGSLWRLSDATGALDGAPFTAPLLELREGEAGEPDRIAAELNLTRLDMNRLLGAPAQDEAEGADLPLRTFAMPDPLLRLRLKADAFSYGRLHGSDGVLGLDVQPGRLALDPLGLTAFGGRIAGRATLEAEEVGGRIKVEAGFEQADFDTLRRALGLRELPLRGRMDGRAVAEATGETLNQAMRGASIAAVVAMRGGSIARSVIELAATDVRALFRHAPGETPLTCLLGVVAIHAGRGEAAPLRVRAATGAITGHAMFDLNRRWLDMLVASERRSTSVFALDVPMRITGDFADPEIRPAAWSREGRARLATTGRVAPLPAALRDFAQRSACFSR